MSNRSTGRITAADKALQAASVDELAEKIADTVRNEIKKRFIEAIEKKKHAEDSVEAGREFVEAYVQYVHFIEGIHNMVTKGRNITTEKSRDIKLLTSGASAQKAVTIPNNSAKNGKKKTE